MPRLKLLLAYQGTAYAGWQIQALPKGGSPPTIQGELERAVAAITGGRIPVHGSGRTDSGVHAEGQVCHVDLPGEKIGLDWQRALNAQLPPDIRILNAEIVDADFHARFSATGKCYSYALWHDAQRPLPRAREFVWGRPGLVQERMLEAAALLTGTHDFASFQNTGTPVESTVRTLHSIEARPHCLGPLLCPEDWPVTSWIFIGDGFLKQMVRNLVGLLVWVGQGKITPADVPGILAAKDRCALPSPAAPAHGLTLMHVYYAPFEELLDAYR